MLFTIVVFSDNQALLLTSQEIAQVEWNVIAFILRSERNKLELMLKHTVCVVTVIHTLLNAFYFSIWLLSLASLRRELNIQQWLLLPVFVVHLTLEHENTHTVMPVITESEERGFPQYRQSNMCVIWTIIWHTSTLCSSSSSKWPRGQEMDNMSKNPEAVWLSGALCQIW